MKKRYSIGGGRHHYKVLSNGTADSMDPIAKAIRTVKVDTTFSSDLNDFRKISFKLAQTKSRVSYQYIKPRKHGCNPTKTLLNQGWIF